jgi:glutamyl/glutaminyl-tRNA synthetase
MLGRTAPLLFLHHPLIMGSAGEKLSKSARDTGVRDLRAQGLGPEEVIGRAAAAIGLIASPKPLHASDAASLFL